MTTSDVQSRLQRVFMQVLDVPELSIEPSLKKGDIEAWDSFSHINLMLAIESEFGVEFDSNEIGTLLSVGQISNALRQRLNPAGP